MFQKDDVDVQQVAIVGAFSLILFVAIIVGAQVLFYRSEKADTLFKLKNGMPSEARTLLTEERMKLASYRWVDRQKEVVAIPIERAMELQLKDLQAQAK
jgi:hypothetical protein